MRLGRVDWGERRLDEEAEVVDEQRRALKVNEVQVEPVVEESEQPGV